MDSKTSYSTSNGEQDLTAEVVRAGDDLVVVITGGQAHLGGYAAASPRPSLQDDSATSSDLTSQAFAGHKEDILARRAAHRLCSVLGVRVLVAAGCHWDDLDRQGIDRVLASSDHLTDLIIADLRSGRKPQ